MTKKIKKKDNQKKLQKAVQQKINLFNQTPEECLTCHKPFDKKSKEHATTWFVVVKEEDEDNPVRLYCPECWTRANEILEDFRKMVEEKYPEKVS